MRIYSTVVEHFLSPGEVHAIRVAQSMVGGSRAVEIEAGLAYYEDQPAVVLVHVVGPAAHGERLYVNDDLIMSDQHFEMIDGQPHPAIEGHVCAERIGVLLARSLNIPLDERRVHEKDYADAGHAMSILAFSATVDWPQRGGFAK